MTNSEDLNAQQQLPVPSEVVDEGTLETMRRAAAIGRQLADRATAFVPIIEENRTLEARLDTMDRDEQIRARLPDTALAKFVSSLPRSHRVKGKNSEIFLGLTDPDHYDFSVDSLEAAKVLESLIWWVSVWPKEVNPNAATSSIAKVSRWNEFAYELGTSFFTARGSVDSQIDVPYIMLGERQTRVSEGASDAVKELLLCPLTDDRAPIIIVEASSRILDIADDAGKAHLGKIIKRDNELRQYENPDGSIKIAHKVKRLRQHDSMFGKSKIEFIDEPRSERRKDKYWEKLKSNITFSGVPMSILSARGEIDKQVFIDFNVPLHALQVALLLDAEDVYADTIAKIIAKGLTT